MIARRDVILGYVLLSLAALISLGPLLGVMILALGEPGQIGINLDIANATNFGNFADVWEKGDFGPAIRTSFIITIIVVLVSVILSVPAGYAFALMDFPGRSAIFALLILGILMPLESMIVPLFLDMRRFNLDNNYWSVILPQIGFSVAFGAFWMRAFFVQSARSLVEAAWIDGANSWQTLTRVLVPLARPQMLTLAVLFFVWNWNDFLLPLVMLSGSDLQTAPMALVTFEGARRTDFAYLGAASIITIIPVVIVFILLQRSFTRGILAGSIKE
jgi:raffinose/stachyose/melibiose transport system permease protein